MEYDYRLISFNDSPHLSPPSCLLRFCLAYSKKKSPEYLAPVSKIVLDKKNKSQKITRNPNYTPCSVTVKNPKDIDKVKPTSYNTFLAVYNQTKQRTPAPKYLTGTKAFPARFML
jgi:hypothetical protein